MPLYVPVDHDRDIAAIIESRSHRKVTIIPIQQIMAIRCFVPAIYNVKWFDCCLTVTCPNAQEEDGTFFVNIVMVVGFFIEPRESRF